MSPLPLRLPPGWVPLDSATGRRVAVAAGMAGTGEAAAGGAGPAVAVLPAGAAGDGTAGVPAGPAGAGGTSASDPLGSAPSGSEPSGGAPPGREASKGEPSRSEPPSTAPPGGAPRGDGGRRAEPPAGVLTITALPRDGRPPAEVATELLRELPAAAGMLVLDRSAARCRGGVPAHRILTAHTQGDRSVTTELWLVGGAAPAALCAAVDTARYAELRPGLHRALRSYRP